jgi:hypothetical protein
LLFRVFNIISTENKVNDKYKTKNNITDDNPVFLAIKNQMNANISSVRNLMLTATRLCMIWLAGSLFWPLKKIIRTKRLIRVKIADATPMSLKIRGVSMFVTIMYPAASTSISMIASKNTDLARGFKRWIIFLL